MSHRFYVSIDLYLSIMYLPLLSNVSVTCQYTAYNLQKLSSRFYFKKSRWWLFGNFTLHSKWRLSVTGWSKSCAHGAIHDNAGRKKDPEIICHLSKGTWIQFLQPRKKKCALFFNVHKKKNLLKTELWIMSPTSLKPESWKHLPFYWFHLLWKPSGFWAS